MLMIQYVKQDSTSYKATADNNMCQFCHSVTQVETVIEQPPKTNPQPSGCTHHNNKTPTE